MVFVPTDVGHEGDVALLVEAATARFGHLDVAVNAAAIEFETVPLAECSGEDYDRMMDVNARGVFWCMKYELAAMLRGGRGGSLAATVPSLTIKGKLDMKKMAEEIRKGLAARGED